MNVSFDKSQGVVICSIYGELDMYEAPDFHAKYDGVAARETECAFVIDLGKTSYIDSSGIGVLFQIFTDAKARRAGFCICGASGMVDKLLRLSKMSSILPVEKTLMSAIQHARSHA